MPYKKNYKKKVIKRKPQRKQGFLRKAMGAGAMAYSALVMAKRLKDMVNTEYKFYDIQNASNPDWTGSLSTLNTIPVGTADNQRIGDSVKLQNLTIRGNVIAHTSSPAFVRMLIVWDPQAKTSTTADVLEYVSTQYAPFSPKDYDKRFQTRILADKLFSVMPSDEIQKPFDLVVPINQHTQYENGGTTINSGALKILLISNVSVNVPGVVYLARISYTDN